MDTQRGVIDVKRVLTVVTVWVMCSACKNISYESFMKTFKRLCSVKNDPKLGHKLKNIKRSLGKCLFIHSSSYLGMVRERQNCQKLVIIEKKTQIISSDLVKTY